MEDQELAQLELFCKQLYESPDINVRNEAEKALIVLANSPDCLTKCQYLLERGNSSYSQLLAASTLTKLTSRTTNPLPIEQRLVIRNYCLNYFATRPKLAPFVTQALAQLLSKLTKYGWFENQSDNYMFRSITDDIGQFLQRSIEHCIIGVKVLTELVSFMNQAEGHLPLSRNRKISSSFRDVALYDIFSSGLSMLKQMASKQLDLQDENQMGVVSGLLQLCRNCLMYDFIGTSFDESVDDMGTVHVPTTWKQLFLDFNTLNLFLDLYQATPANISALALACYVQMASVRRSLFDQTERQKYLQQLMNGIKKILQNPQALEELDNYHQFCRLLARLKANYQLGEIIKTDGYRETMEMVTKFSVTSLQVWQFSPNSVFYLLNMWQKMVASCPFLKENDSHMLGTFTPEVTKAYITSRLESVTDVIRNGVDDPLSDKATLYQQLDQLATIGRCEYQKTCTLLISLFDTAAQSYQDLISSSNPMAQDISLQQGRLTWLVFIIAYSIGARVAFTSKDEHDTLDGELCCRVLQLMNLTDLKLPQGGCEKLEIAILMFFNEFRKIYIGDQINKGSKVYQVLSERVGITNETMMLTVFVRKMITNMKYWSSSEQIITSTLTLLSDLSSGFSSARKLVKLEAVQFLLSNHTPEHFPFLGLQASAIIKCRSMFYSALGRLLLVDMGDEDERFQLFTMPLTAVLQNLIDRFSSSSSAYDNAETKQLVIGICRDLKGLVFAFNTRTSYMLFFEWLYPKFTSTFHKALELWYHDTSITSVILKLWTEMAQNRSQRLQFDVMSPNGVLLFREISKTLATYGGRILSIGTIPEDQVYSVKLKGITLCFNMLKAALSGGFVNFGVLRLYSDEALDNALQVFVKLLLSIRQQDILDYPKLCQAYFGLVEIICQDHIDELCHFDPQIFMYILSTISEGLTALETAISTECCATLDHIVTYMFHKMQKESKVPGSQKENAAVKVLELQPELLQQMLSTVLNVVMFEDCRNAWSMSRPLLGLILLNEKFFAELERRLTEIQPIEKQQSMARLFQELMEHVDRSLVVKNRDRFTQNLSSFRLSVKSLTGRATVSPSSTAIEMMG